MNIFNFIVISLFLHLQQGYCKTIVESSKNKVIGGQTASSLEQFPFVASIQVLTETGYVHSCSGSICGSRHIITAAHCLDGRTPETMLILVGTLELVEKKVHPYRGQFFRVKKITTHEDYGPPQNDIAIIEIIGKINFQCNSIEESLPASIGMSLTETKDGTMCFIIGWGFVQTPLIHENPALPNTLRWAKVPVYNHAKCMTDYAYGAGGSDFTFSNGTICAGQEQGGISTCFGDSGSSLICNGNLVGVVSFGSRICGEPRKPGVFTEVFQYLTWISKHGCTLCNHEE